MIRNHAKSQFQVARAEFLKNLIYPIQENKLKLKYKNAKSEFCFDLRCKPYPFKCDSQDQRKEWPKVLSWTNSRNKLRQPGRGRGIKRLCQQKSLFTYNRVSPGRSSCESVRKCPNELMSKLINIMRYMFKN